MTKRTPLKILETPVRFYPYIGGVENHVYYLSAQLDRLGHHVSVVCANDPVTGGDENIRGVKVKRLGYVCKVANTNITLGLPPALWKTDFDIVHTHMPTPWTTDWSVLIAKLKHKPVVLTVHNDMDKPGFVGKAITWLYMHTFFLLAIRFVDKIIIVNEAWRTSFTKTSHLLEREMEKIVTIPNGVDIEMFTPPAERSVSNTILFVSILDKHHRFKGFDYLLNALPKIKASVPDVQLLVVGDGELVQEYQQQAREMGIAGNVQFLGGKTQEELVSLYQKAGVFVLPSIEIEGFGIVLLEAMACGLPVVTTEVAGLAREIQQEGAGIIVPSRDSDELALATVAILQSAQKRKEMGERGNALVRERYSWKIVATRIALLFEKLCYERNA